MKLPVLALGYERLRLVQPAGRSLTRDFRLKASSAELAGVLDQQGRPCWSALDVDYESQSSSVSIGQFQLFGPMQQYSIYPSPIPT